MRGHTAARTIAALAASFVFFFAFAADKKQEAQVPPPLLAHLDEHSVATSLTVALLGEQLDASSAVPCGNTGFSCDPGWYFCNNCNGQRNKCVPPTDEALAKARACCSILVRCG